MIQKKCRFCGKIFFTNFKKKVACSEKCRDKSSPSRIKRKAVLIKNNLYVGNPTPVFKVILL